MRKLPAICILCLLFPLSLAANNVKISVLTCSPGDEVYSLFGHTAIRYVNEERNIDEVFNYGYFDFDTPGFMSKFILGETDYWVGSVPYRFFLIEYAERGSAVVEQVLNLPPEQEEAIYDALKENSAPENRIYRYNYFYNNCTTKVRDRILEVLGCETLMLNDSVVTGTFRDELHNITVNNPWISFGIDLMLGADVDRQASLHELQFLPMNFCRNLEKAYILAEDSVKVPLVSETNLLVAENKPAITRSHLTPFNSSILLLVLTFIVMLCELRSKKCYWGYDIIIMLLQGAAGCLLLFMSIFSEHPAVGSNYLIILLNPFALILMPVLVYCAIKKKSMKIAWVQVLFVALFLISAIIGLQNYPAPTYFIAAALLSRSLFHIYKKDICELNIL